MTPPSLPHPLIDDQALRRRLVALARHWLAQGDEAEDLVQETWLRTAWGALPASPGSREAWLATVLRHLCIDAWRRRQRCRAALGQHFEADEPLSSEAAPEQLAEQAQRVEQALRQLVRALPAKDVMLVLLCEVFGFSHAELGALTGRSEAASRQQLRRMLLRLRRAEREGPPLEEDSGELLALCQLAIAQRDPAGLVAALRTCTPQAMALCAQAAPSTAAAGSASATTQLVQIGNLLSLRIQIANGPANWLPLGEAVAA